MKLKNTNFLLKLMAKNITN